MSHSPQGIRREFTIRFTTAEHGRRTTDTATPPRVGHVPRVARLLALAHHFDRLIAQGVVKDYAEIARLTLLSRARITQIMTLKFLAPDIQEQIAWLPNSHGKDALLEKSVRRIALMSEWDRQRQYWHHLMGRC